MLPSQDDPFKWTAICCHQSPFSSQSSNQSLFYFSLLFICTVNYQNRNTHCFYPQNIVENVDVTIIADQFDVNTTSDGAAGIFRPTVAKTPGVALSRLRYVSKAPGVPLSTSRYVFKTPQVPLSTLRYVLKTPGCHCQPAVMCLKHPGCHCQHFGASTHLSSFHMQRHDFLRGVKWAPLNVTPLRQWNQLFII